MNPQDELRHLVRGYATGNLSEDQRRALFEAALEDQELFDELAREDELRELLETIGARERLTAALAPPEHRRFGTAWWWAAGSAAAAAVVLATFLWMRQPKPVEIAAVQVAPQQARDAVEASRPVPSRAPEPSAVRSAQPAAAPPAAPPPVRAKTEAQAADQATEQSSRESTAPVAGAVGGVMEEKKAEAPPPPSAAPPPPPRRFEPPAPPAPQVAETASPLTATQDTSNRAGFAAGTLAKTASSLAFSYSLEGQTLRLTPGVNGTLSVSFGSDVASVQTTGREGMPISIPIPPTATQIILGYTTGAGGITGTPARISSSGSVSFPASSPDRVLVEIPLPAR